MGSCCTSNDTTNPNPSHLNRNVEPKDTNHGDGDETVTATEKTRTECIHKNSGSEHSDEQINLKQVHFDEDELSEETNGFCTLRNSMTMKYYSDISDESESEEYTNGSTPNDDGKSNTTETILSSSSSLDDESLDAQTPSLLQTPSITYDDIQYK